MNALVHRLDVALHRFVGRYLFFQLGDHAFQRFKRQIGVDRFRAIARQRAELVHFAGLARFNDKAHGGAKTPADEIVMRGGGGEKGRQRHALARHGAVRQNDDVVAILHGALGKPAHAVKRRFHVFRPVGHIIGDIDGGGAERVFADLANGANALEVLIGENGLRDFQAAYASRCP